MTAKALLFSLAIAITACGGEAPPPQTPRASPPAPIAIRNAGDFPALMAVAHPDDGVRERAKQCEPKVDHLETDVWLDATLARVVKRYAAKKETLSPPRARMLEHTLRDFRRNGLE